MHLKNAPVTGWRKGAALQKSAPAALRSNCGYLASFMAAACTTGAQAAACNTKLQCSLQAMRLLAAGAATAVRGTLSSPADL